MSRTATKTKAQNETLFGKLPEQAPATTPVATTAKPKTKKGTDKPPASQAVVVPLRPDTRNTLTILADAMKDPNFKPENFRLVCDMHREMVAEGNRLDYIAAKRALTRDLPVINKDGRIEYRDKGDGKGKPKPLQFASFENINEVIRPLLDKHGFDLWFSSEPGSTGMINVIGHLEHENGHVRRTVFPMPHDTSGGKSAAQGWASAFSFGKRVATIGLLNIRTRALSDRDTDGARPKVTKGGDPQTIEGSVLVEGEGVAHREEVPLCSQEQLDRVREAIEACGVKTTGPKSFCAHFGIAKVADLPAADYADAIEACRQYGARSK